MKKIVLLAVILIGLNAFSQDMNRMEVKGKIIVENNDVEGIALINKSSNKWAITNLKGEFVLEVKLNDIIEVSALKYENIIFTVNDAVIQSGVMKIYLIEEIKMLDEVIVTNNKLTGNLNNDIKTRGHFEYKQDAFYFSTNHSYNISNSNSEGINTVALNPNHSIAMNPERQGMINGLDIVNVVDQLLLPLFRTEVKDKKTSGIPEVPVESVKYYLGSDFLVENFNIPEHRVEEFIRYVESKDFDFSLLNYGSEMEFLELLYQKSIQFLNKEK